ncbi:D-2-hydroxyacid dehydrogenase [Bacillus sp. FJAT-45350]|uniref:D-2-hydroxyacid dehydrogenase n=1 Tax=Bacillus sp. FJAT-45350 TaxID=2011014 RepID=UPI000BB93F53|nr:D-2-hydroxyacid dehydrogenase [Bacillus sp. FJAT-45350]
MEINNILVSSGIYDEIKDIIEKKNINKQFKYLPENEVTKEHLSWADAFVSFRPSPSFSFENIKWVHSIGAGVDGFLYNKEWKEDVLLTRTVCSFGQRISEYCLSYILRDIQLHRKFQRLQTEKKWTPIAPKLLNEQKVIIYGTGVIGQEVGQLLTSLGLEVYGVSQSGKQKDGFHSVLTIDNEFSVLKEMNYVINTLPLTAETEGLFNKKRFNHFSRAVFINIGRGQSVEETALIDALDNKDVKSAVLDVFPEEPLPVESQLWEREDVFITPHISAVTTPEEAVDCFIETLEKIEKGEPLSNKVDVKKGF